MAMQLIPLHNRSINEQTLDTVNARDLHTFLELGRDFSNWIKARIAQYGFIEGEDFMCVENLSSPKRASSKSRTQKVKEYFVTLDMAKELAMVERNDKGKQARRYFIDCEKQQREAQQNPQKHLPAAQPDNPDDDKYKLLNTMILSMDFKTNPVVVSNIELVSIIRAVRLQQQQIAQLQTPDWVNDSIDQLKKATKRTFADF